MRDPRRFGWRTAMILPELATDVAVQNSDAYRVALGRLLEAKDFLSNVFSVRRSADPAARAAVRAHVQAEMGVMQRDLRSLFGSPFGSLCSSDTQSSLFGLRMYRWADVYTSSVRNFEALQLDAYLSPRSTTKVLSHDVRIAL